LPRSGSEILLQPLPRLKYAKTDDLCGSFHEAILVVDQLLPSPGIYEKVIKVKADVAAVLD